MRYFSLRAIVNKLFLEFLHTNLRVIPIEATEENLFTPRFTINTPNAKPNAIESGIKIFHAWNVEQKCLLSRPSYFRLARFWRNVTKDSGGNLIQDFPFSKVPQAIWIRDPKKRKFLEKFLEKHFPTPTHILFVQCRMSLFVHPEAQRKH